MKLIGLDTNIFIYYFGAHPQFGPPARAIFQKLVQHKVKAVTSVISYIELLSLKSSDEENTRLQSFFLEIPQLTVVDVTPIIGEEAARIRRAYGYRIPDALQLATAVAMKAEVFVTNDERLQGFDGVTVELLKRDGP